MSYSQTIKDILNILDLNIIFNENCLSTKKVKGVYSRIFSGFLDESTKVSAQWNLLTKVKKILEVTSKESL